MLKGPFYNDHKLTLLLFNICQTYLLIIFYVFLENANDPKYDIREWASEHAKMGKGITLSKDEMIKLKELLEGIQL